LDGSTVAPSFRFGVQKQYKILGDFNSRLGKRKNKGEDYASGGKYLFPDKSGDLSAADDSPEKK
jgi:hypothetical protein